jgi:hypothetical protein
MTTWVWIATAWVCILIGRLLDIPILALVGLACSIMGLIESIRGLKK